MLTSRTQGLNIHPICAFEFRGGTDLAIAREVVLLCCSDSIHPRYAALQAADALGHAGARSASCRGDGRPRTLGRCTTFQGGAWRFQARYRQVGGPEPRHRQDRSEGKACVECQKGTSANADTCRGRRKAEAEEGFALILISLRASWVTSISLLHHFDTGLRRFLTSCVACVPSTPFANMIP
jgi:hypothetical protein